MFLSTKQALDESYSTELAVKDKNVAEASAEAARFRVGWGHGSFKLCKK
jgi:hypothetical protein